MECQICYEILESNINICITKCRHRFCSQCIFTWIRKNQTCPVCRKNLLEHDDACLQIDPRQSSFSAHRQYQNNFINLRYMYDLENRMTKTFRGKKSKDFADKLQLLSQHILNIHDSS